ncbi:MAG: hypothetical protein GC203_01015 [Phenylobacterium sp.]|uniref:hypothetical protein n=1 Tax=Phenylobacterium sp. TaxID=1871053 RepID=UPI0025FC1EC5|nr:hypothetical protein [Phenylobacterium sp.]MBI1196423.1 hypothetical protein [Phenylobacterium sp.]
MKTDRRAVAPTHPVDAERGHTIDRADDVIGHGGGFKAALKPARGRPPAPRGHGSSRDGFRGAGNRLAVDGAGQALGTKGNTSRIAA